MTPKTDVTIPEDSQLEEILAFDRALASGDDPFPGIEPGSSLAAVHECQRLLEAVWPRCAPLSLDLPKEFGRYMIERELGRGAFGVVFLAADTVLGRRVALKVPRLEILVTPDIRRRFLREAEAASRLDHPHIVPVYDVGEVGPVCYIASAYCEGTTLAEWLRGNLEPVPFVLAARLVAMLAAAVGHAHERGILHRDLKPTNILLIRAGASGAGSGGLCRAIGLVPRICDFGLAKLLDQESHETCSGVPIGSPNYMAPEQAAGRLREHGPATDVYALGAILYELLAHRPPHRGETDLETLRLVTDQDPTSLRALSPGVPRDLETIVGKCLNKQPKGRYATASELADDLERFIAGRSVRARPIRSWQRAGKWARRRPAHAALAIMSLLAISVALGALFWYRDVVQRHDETLRTAVALATRDTQLVERSAHDTIIQDARARERVLTAELADRYALGSQIKLIHETLESGNIGLAAFMLEAHRPGPGQKQPRGFAWLFLRRLFHPDEFPLGPEFHYGTPAFLKLAIAPDGRGLAAGMSDGRVDVWDLAQGRIRATVKNATGPGDNSVYNLAFSRDGRLLAAVSPPFTVKVWDLSTFKQVAALPEQLNGERAHLNGIIEVKFTDAADYLMVFAQGWLNGKLEVWVWKVPEGDDQPQFKARLNQKQLPHFAREGPLQDPSWSRASEAAAPWLAYARDHLAVLDDGLTLAIKEGPDDATLYEPYQHTLVTRIHRALAVPAIQDRGHTGLTQTEIERLRNQARRVVDASQKGDRSAPPRADLVRFSPDGRTIAVHLGGAHLGGLGVALIDAASGRTFLTNAPSRWRVVDLVFTPDGRSLVTAGFDSKIHVWRLESNSLAGHAKETWSLAFSPDGKSLASAADDGTIKLWEIASGRGRATLNGHGSLVTAVAYSPDGATLASAGFDKTVRLWDAASGAPLATLRGHSGRVRSLAFGPHGKALASAGDDRTIRIWDVAEKKELSAPLTGHKNSVFSLVFAQDGKTVFSGSLDKTIGLWDWSQGRTRGVWPTDEQVYCLAVSADDQTLASGHEEGSIVLWSVAAGTARASLRRHTGDVLGLAFCPDGLTLASTGRDNTVRIWDPATGQELLTLNGHQAPVHAATFSPDGSILATGSHDGAIKLWRSEPQRETRDRLSASVISGTSR